jgi:hypothetical protein
MGKYLDILRRVEAQRSHYDRNDIDDQRPHVAVRSTDFGRLGRFCRRAPPFSQAFEALEHRCPARIDIIDWRQAVEDGRRFLSRWSDRAVALGWTARDLFGLSPVPDKPAPSYRRLSRYDETGLIWLLHGRPVVALTDTTAAIENSTGAVTIYRRHNKPALGPLGDSLEDCTS